jgi:hypothetical protein
MGLIIEVKKCWSSWDLIIVVKKCWSSWDLIIVVKELWFSENCSGVLIPPQYF